MSPRPIGMKPDDLPARDVRDKRTADKRAVEKRAVDDWPTDMVDESSKESFPASDPPSWTPERTGSPDNSPR